jgi:3-oxoacyl-[acyl-carrier protein] reductase
MDLSGKVAIVTGGTGGLGGCIIEAFVKAGTSVALVYRDSRELAETRAREMSAHGPRVVPIQADVATESGAHAMVRQTLDALGRVDILVNDAAYNQWVPFTDLDGLTEEIWTKILTTNATGPFLCSKAVAPAMREQGAGRIVNISSVAGLDPGGSSIAYAVSKAALNHLTKCLAVALAPTILVNCVAPGLLEGTRMTDNLAPQFAQTARDRALLKRAAHKEDVAEHVLGFARTDSTTGQTLVVDAGRVFH